MSFDSEKEAIEYFKAKGFTEFALTEISNNHHEKEDHESSKRI